MFLSAIGGPSHGRVPGFGSLLDKKVQTATTRDRQNHAASSVSVLTQNGVQETYTKEQMQAIVQERDRRHDEERAARMRDQAENRYFFAQLFRLHGMPQPTPLVSKIKFRVIFGF